MPHVKNMYVVLKLPNSNPGHFVRKWSHFVHFPTQKLKLEEEQLRQCDCMVPAVMSYVVWRHRAAHSSVPPSYLRTEDWMVAVSYWWADRHPKWGESIKNPVAMWFFPSPHVIASIFISHFISSASETWCLYRLFWPKWLKNWWRAVQHTKKWYY